MNKTTKAFALLFTAGLVLAGCGQKQDSTATTQTETTAEATTAAPTTATPTTATPTTVDSLADAKKTVLEAGDEAAKATLTLYYKDDVLLKQESVTTYIVSKMEGENPLQVLKDSSAKTEEKLKDFIGKGFEFKTDYKDDIFTFTYSFDYTKLDLQKLKDFIPDLNLRDDNTISYSDYKASLAQQGYKEKQTTATKENAVQPVQAPAGQEVAVFRATLGEEVTEYIVYHKGDTITKVIFKMHRDFEKYGKSKDTALEAEKLSTAKGVEEKKAKYSSVDGVSFSYEINGYTVTTIDEYDYTKIDFAKLKEIDPKKTHSSSFSEMKSEFERQKLFKQVQ